MRRARRTTVTALVAGTACAAVYVAWRLGSAERARLKQHTALLRDELARVLASRSDFLSALAHELRTPATAILGISQTLSRRFEDLEPAQVKEFIERLAANAGILSRTLAGADLLSAPSGQADATRRVTMVSDLVRVSAAKFGRLASHQLVADDRPVLAYLDPDRFELILDHLLGNVLRHTPRGTHAWVRCETTADGLLLTVEDDGPGIPDHEKDRLFRPFEQRHLLAHAPGLGLGLAVVARLAALEGGRAWVEDRLGGGSSFKVLIPQTQADARVGRPQRSPRRDGTLHRALQRRKTGPSG